LTARRWQRLRKAVQILSLLAYVALFVYANAQRPQRFWADLFSRLDPLLMLAPSLAGRLLLGGLGLAAIVLVVTLLFGRVWCGWFCPLGTVLSWLGPRRQRHRAPLEGWRAIKILLLISILTAALLGNLTLLVLDPITIANRTLATAAWPALRFAVVQSEALLYGVPLLWGPLDAIHAAVIQPLFLDVQPVFSLASLIAVLFLVLVTLNWRAERFWCRYLCPLGGLLGLVSKFSLVRREVGGECTECGRCAIRCPTGTIDRKRGFESDPAECIVCTDCLVDCEQGGVAFRWRLPAGKSSTARRWRPADARDYDPSRRQALAAIGASAVGVALAGVEPITLREPSTLIRPPGARLTGFSALCTRCAACVRVCPTQGLQPSLFEGGVQNLLTPRLRPRLGYCSFGCNACGQVCPTGAIPELLLEEKQATVLGLASVNRDRCLPWAYDQACIVCEEACPVADKAITLEEVTVLDAQGQPRVLQRPRVIKDLCIGCGICEYQCPLGGEAAIRVHVPTEVSGWF
jgi:polyferredoxin